MRITCLRQSYSLGPKFQPKCWSLETGKGQAMDHGDLSLASILIASRYTWTSQLSELWDIMWTGMKEVASTTGVEDTKGVASIATPLLQILITGATSALTTEVNVRLSHPTIPGNKGSHSLLPHPTHHFSQGRRMEAMAGTGRCRCRAVPSSKTCSRAQVGIMAAVGGTNSTTTAETTGGTISGMTADISSRATTLDGIMPRHHLQEDTNGVESSRFLSFDQLKAVFFLFDVSQCLFFSLWVA